MSRNRLVLAAWAAFGGALWTVGAQTPPPKPEPPAADLVAPVAPVPPVPPVAPAPPAKPIDWDSDVDFDGGREAARAAREEMRAQSEQMRELARADAAMARAQAEELRAKVATRGFGAMKGEISAGLALAQASAKIAGRRRDSEDRAYQRGQNALDRRN